MENTDCSLQRLVTQVGKEMLKVWWHDQAFVGDNTIWQATNIKIGFINYRHLDTTADHEETSGYFFMGCIVRLQENLLNGR